MRINKPFVFGFAVVILILSATHDKPKAYEMALYYIFLCVIVLVCIQVILDRRATRKTASGQLRYVFRPSTTKKE